MARSRNSLGADPEMTQAEAEAEVAVAPTKVRGRKAAASKATAAPLTDAEIVEAAEELLPHATDRAIVEMAAKPKPATTRRGDDLAIGELAKLVGADVELPAGGDYAKLVVPREGKPLTLCWASGRKGYVRLDHLVRDVADAPATTRGMLKEEKPGVVHVTPPNAARVATFLRWCGEAGKPPRNKP